MGVPGLARYIFSTYPRFVHSKLEKKCGYLFIDSNSLLHEACQFVFRYGKFENGLPFDNKLGKTMDELNVEVFQRYVQKIQSIIDFTSPCEIVFIAVDGTAPLAKQFQQRQRRFRNNGTMFNNFDPNCLTPGTKFMEDLEMYVQKVGIPTGLHVPCGCSVVFSPQSIPGEGEHKLLDFIRTYPNLGQNETVYIFGPDGDLFFLTLGLNTANVFLVREDEMTKYLVVDITGIKTHKQFALNVYNQNIVAKNVRRHSEVANDFILTSSLFGNDFLPRIQMFNSVEHGINEVFQVLGRMSKLKSYITYTTFSNGKPVEGVMMKNLKTFFGYISEFEYTTIEKQALVDVEEKFKDVILTSCMSNGKLDVDEYKKKYYLTRVGLKSMNDIRCMCENYVQTMVWVYYYYTQGVNVSGWETMYTYLYAPLVTDIALYVQTIPTATLTDMFVRCMKKPDSRPSTCLEQLIGVLPRQSASLIYDDVARKIHKDICGNDDVVIEIDYQGKTKDYQGIVKIPFVDNGLIRKLMQSFYKTPNEELKIFVKS